MITATPKGIPITILLFFLTLFCTALPTWSATYYLNPATGSDANRGTAPGQPWKTMPKVKASAGPGDTVNILGGTYTQSQMEPATGVPAWTETQAHGTTGSPLVVQANPGDTVIVDGQGKQYWQYFEPAKGPRPGFAPARHLIIQNLQFRNYAGAVITIGSASYMAVLNCHFTHFAPSTTGVPLVTLYSHHVILRGNTIRSTSSHMVYISDGSQDVVVERTYGEESCKYGLHVWGHGDYTQTTKNVILRNNTLVNIHSAGTIASGGNFTNLYIYQNTSYQEAIPCPSQYTVAGGAMVSFHLEGNWNNTHVVNNIGYGHAAMAPVYVDDAASFHGSLFLDYNLWTNLKNSAQVYAWQRRAAALEAFRAATGHDQHSLTSDPRFVNVTTRDFTLQPTSPAIDAGTFLTTTVRAGTGTTIAVADAGFFIDGYGLVPGDMIQVGGNSPVRVTAINYDTNALTVTFPLAWTAGQGVSLPYAGARPDMGAFESGGTAIDARPVPANLRLRTLP